jgi:hypothetical protein
MMAEPTRGNMPRRKDIRIIEFKSRDEADTNTRRCCLCGHKIKRSEIGYYVVEIVMKDGTLLSDVAHRRCAKEV